MAAIYNFSLDQGATKRVALIWMYRSGGTDEAPTYTRYDLAHCTARMQLRLLHDQPILLQLTTENGGIEIEPTDSQIVLAMSAIQTGALELKKCVYDLEIIFPSGDVKRVIQGKITVSMNVTE